jgi:hypothetical protein
MVDNNLYKHVELNWIQFHRKNYTLHPILLKYLQVEL